MSDEYFDRFDELLYIILFFISLLVAVNMAAGFFGFRITWYFVVGEIAVLGYGFYKYATISSKKTDRLSYLAAAALAACAAGYAMLLKYFQVIRWDGASYLLGADLFNTQQVILPAFYRPMVWSSLLSMGTAFGAKEIVSVLSVVMLAASVYLFTLELTRDKKTALASIIIAALSPVVLSWGLSYYSEAFLATAVALGFACYFRYNNTGSLGHYSFSVMLFTMAFLTRYSFGLLLIIPAYEFIFRHRRFSTALPFGAIIVPFILFIWLETGNPVYAFTKYFEIAQADVGHNVFTNMYYLDQMDLLFSWGIFICAVAGTALIFAYRRSRNLLALFAVFALESAYFLIFFHLKDERYFMFMVPLTACAAAFLLSRLQAGLLKRFGIAFPVMMLLLTAYLAHVYVADVQPSYHYTGKDILQETAQYLSGASGNVMSNSQVRLSWYLKKRVVSAVPPDQLNDSVAKNNVTYLVNFEKSGSPASFRNTSLLSATGAVVATFTDGVEKINIIKVR